MKKIYIISAILLSISFSLYSQGKVSEDVLNKELQKIYDNFEYKTIPQNGFFETWVINDRNLIREMLVKFLNRGALMNPDGTVWTEDDYNNKLADDVFKGNLKIVCEKRYYDTEIAKLMFVNSNKPDNVPAELKDWVSLSDVLEKLYPIVKEKKYSFTDLTKREYNSDQKYNMDIYLNAINPRYMIWNNVDGEIATDYFWVVSAFGRLGFDNINLPMWHKGSMVAGINIDFLDKVFKKDRNYKRFSLYLGIDEPVFFSVKTKQGSNNQLFKDRLLTGLGSNVLIGGTYTLIPPGGFGMWGDYLTGAAEASINISQKDKYAFPITNPVFNSVKNIISLSASFKHADFGFAKVNNIGLFNYGMDLSWYSLYNMTINSPTNKLQRADRMQSHWVLSPQLGISQEGDLIQYSLNLNYSHDFSPEYKPFGYVGIKSLIMIGNMIGIDVRYFKAVIFTDNLPPWQYDNYIVLSPIIRINY